MVPQGEPWPQWWSIDPFPNFTKKVESQGAEKTPECLDSGMYS